MQTSTQLTLSADRALALFQEEARHHEVPSEQTRNGLKVMSPYGEILLAREPAGISITLNAVDDVKLYVLQETVDHVLGEIGEADGIRWSSTVAGARPANMTTAAVVSCKRISPSYFRVRLADPGLERFSREGLHFRLLFGPADRPGELPSILETGRTDWPGGSSAWHRPVYTVRAIDPMAGTLDFDVFVHEGGRVTEWCKTVSPGENVAIMGPGGGWFPKAGWLGLFGDETALPAIARILASAPAETQGVAAIVVTHPDDVQVLGHPEGISLKWLVRGRDETLVEALEAVEPPASDRLIWFAGEKAEVEAARRHSRKLNLAKDEWQAAAYWRRETNDN